jgi:hypothetical protein
LPPTSTGVSGGRAARIAARCGGDANTRALDRRRVVAGRSTRHALRRAC